jgi:tRNA(Ile)-lysidine synthase
MPAASGRLLRPMLAVSRADVRYYLLEKNISWREDSTNADTRFFRNRLRNRLPLLDAEFPQWRKAVASFAETQSLAANFIRDEAAGRIQWELARRAPSPQSPVPSPQLLRTNAENFFAQPDIIREEALFQGIDKLLANSTLSSTVKRKNIRRFAQGNITAIDLGPLQLRKDTKQVMILPNAAKPHPQPLFPNPQSLIPDPHSLIPDPQSPVPNYSFTLLINAPGLYTLKGIAIEVHESQAGENRGCGTFLSLLPLVVKPFQKGDCIVNAGSEKNKGGKPCFTVADTHGVAALIGPEGLIQCKDEREALRAAGKYWVVKISVNGSTDVKRTE